MVVRLWVKRGRNSEIVDGAVSSYDQEPYILFIGRNEDSVADIDETDLMDSATSLSPLSKKLEENVERFTSWMNRDGYLSWEMSNVRA